MNQIFNKMFLLLSQKLCLVTIVFLSILKCMNCDCGQPGIPFEGNITTQMKSSYSENFTIQYYCKNERKLFYKSSRSCREGKWTGRVPKCGKY
jgi:hypothetical protein